MFHTPLAPQPTPASSVAQVVILTVMPQATISKRPGAGTSRIRNITHYGEAGPRPAGMVMTVDFELEGHGITCGWLKDRYGLSWQITPVRLTELLNDPDEAAAQRVMAAMLQMTKIDIAEPERASAAGA